MASLRFRKPAGGGFLTAFKNVGSILPATVLRRLGTWLANRMRERTLSGRSTTGAAFRPYSPAYAAQKGVSRTSVDLKLTGQMLAGIKVLKATRRSILVGVRGKAGAKARAHERGQGVPRRPFLGLSPADRKAFRLELRKELRTVIRRRR